MNVQPANAIRGSRRFVRAIVFAAAVSAVSVLLFSPACGPKRDALPMTTDSVVTPYQEFEKSELYFYDGPYKRWVLKSDRMWKPLGDTCSLVGTPVHLTLFDSTGKVGSIVLADSGTAAPSMKSFVVWGNVFVRSFDSLKIKSEKLSWSQDAHKVTSDTFVQIETPKGDVLRGKGLVADEDFSTWTLKQNVSGQFPDFKKRIEDKNGF